MAVFFIDISDQNVFVIDDEGMDFIDVEDAKAAAVAALPGMARDVLLDSDERTLFAVVRDQAGRSLLRVSLTLRVEPLIAATAS